MPQAQNTKAAERQRIRIKLTAGRHAKADDKAGLDLHYGLQPIRGRK